MLEAGTFTGAVKAKPGRFARAEGWTLFPDALEPISPTISHLVLLVYLHPRHLACIVRLLFN